MITTISTDFFSLRDIFNLNVFQISEITQNMFFKWNKNRNQYQKEISEIYKYVEIKQYTPK